MEQTQEEHYQLWNYYEALDVIKLVLTKEEYMGFLKANILKYKLRNKGQDEADNVKVKDYQEELNKYI